MSSLKIMFWNARSVCNKKLDFFNYIVTNDIDIALISETWLKPNVSFNLMNYRCYRHDRQDSVGGGVAVIIKGSIVHELCTPLKLDVIEAIGIKIQINGNSFFYIWSVYFVGGVFDSVKGSKFNSDLSKLTSSNSNSSYFICGDLNARHSFWGCAKKNKWGDTLYNKFINNRFSLLFPPHPTFFPSSSRGCPSVLDLVITNAPSLCTELHTSNALSSDHLPVHFKLSATVNISKSFVYDIQNTNWYFYQQSIKRAVNKYPPVNTVQDIDESISRFVHDVHSAFDLSTPKKPRFLLKYNLPSDLLELIKQRKKMRKLWQRTRILSYKQEFNILTNSIKTYFEKIRNSKFSEVLEGLEKGSRGVWKLTKFFKNKSNTLPAIKHEDNVFYTNAEKANVLSEVFLKAHQSTALISVPEIEAAVQGSLRTLESNVTSQSVMQTDLNSVTLIVKTLKTRKAVGLDKINNKHLKALPREGLKFLVSLFNCCLKLTYFPRVWKITKVIALPKIGKDPSLAESYRPISLLSSLSKVFEKIIKSHLDIIIENLHLIPDEQFGFRSGHSTTHQLCRLVRDIKYSLANKKSTVVVALDIQKAFDAVWHNGLIFKMMRMKIPLQICKIIKSFMTDRKFAVYVANTPSQNLCVPAGVPQGSVLGPILYSLYISDLPKNPHTNLALFADDTCLYSSGNCISSLVSDINLHLLELEKFFTRWKIKLNSSKTQAMVFTRKRKENLLGNKIVCDGSHIEWASCLKYLGLILDKGLTFKINTTERILKVNKLIKTLYPLICRKSSLNVANKLIIYKMIFLPTLLYACPVWASFAKCHLKKLQISQNKVLKLALNLPYYHSTTSVHEIADIRFLKELISKYSNKFYENCKYSNNNYIKRLS